jgi:ABC-2 type transport system permease protein
VRWLIVKDLEILRRSPLLVALLVIYPIAIALMIGFALSSPPGKPKVAFYTEVAPGTSKLKFGSQEINISKYAKELFNSIQPIKVHSREAAIAKVRDGQALGALIVPGDIISQLQSLVTTGVGNPTVELVLNSNDPVEGQFVQQAIGSRLNDVEQAVSQQVLRLATTDMRRVLNGGTINFAGQNYHLLGLRNANTILRGTIKSLPQNSPLRTAIGQVVSFAQLAIDGLGFANPVLSSIGRPLTVEQTQLQGRTTPIDSYAVAIAVVLSLMLVTLLLAAGLLALERSEHTYARLVRGLVTPLRLLVGKIALAAGCAGLLALVMSALTSIFVHLDWARFELWIVALSLAAVAFAALGVAIGALAKEVSGASLLAFLLSLPIAFVALVPSDAVSSTVGSALSAIAFLFPFKAALQAASNAFTGAAPGIGWPLVHLAVLAVIFAGLARLAARRLAT